LLDYHLNQALHPSSLAVYLASRDREISATLGNVPPAVEIISARSPILAELERRGQSDGHSRVPSTWDVSPEGLNGTTGPFALAPLRPECLVPIPGRDSRVVGLLVLGGRLSEEPYSTDDKHLLTSVANQAGNALESIRLGEKIAERIEAERHIAQEMEYAKQVQTGYSPRLLGSDITRRVCLEGFKADEFQSTRQRSMQAAYFRRRNRRAPDCARW